MELAAGDSSSWRHWWELNKEPYLDVRRSLRAGNVVTGSDDFFLGRGTKTRAVDTVRVSDEELERELLPILIERLDTERDGRVLAATLLTLARSAAGRGAATLCTLHIEPFLDDGRANVAEAATVALGVLGDPSALPVLEDMLRCQAVALRAERQLDFGAHVSARQRSFAAYALGMIAERADGYTQARVVNGLAAGILGDTHGSHDVHAACVVAMGLVDLPLAPAGAELPERPRALMTRQAQVRWLLGLLDERDVDRRVRSQVPVSLARLLHDVPAGFELRELAVRRMVTLAEPRSGARPTVRRGCVVALGWIGDSDGDELDRLIRAALTEAAGKKSDQVTRHLALIALGRAAGRPGTGAGEPTAGAGEAREFLSRALVRGGTPSRPWSALALAVLERSLDDARGGSGGSSEEMREVLRSALEDARSPEEVGACAIAVGITRDPEAAELLAEKLDSTGDVEARSDLLLALGMVEARGSIEALRKVCQESRFDAKLLPSAAVGLALIGDDELPQVLGGLLGEARGLSSQASLLAAIERAGDARSLPLLIEISQDGQRASAARACAIAALGGVSELDELPWVARLSVGANFLAEVDTLTSFPRGAGILDL